MLSRRLVAGSMLGLAIAICPPRASGQDAKPATKPQTGGGVPLVIELDDNGVLGKIFAGGGEKKDAKPTEKAEKAEALKALEELMKKHPAFGGKIVFQIEAAGADPKSAPGAAAKLEKALKQLSGPADQLDLREVRKLVAEALGEMKKGQPITNNRMLPQGGLQLVPGMGQGWGGPGGALAVDAWAAGKRRGRAGSRSSRWGARKEAQDAHPRRGGETRDAGKDKGRRSAEGTGDEAARGGPQTARWDGQGGEEKAGGRSAVVMAPAAEAEEHLTPTPRRPLRRPHHRPWRASPSPVRRGTPAAAT